MAALARQADPDRYVWALFLPLAARERAFLALAINRELCRIPHVVSEPVLGQMRFQWWRETLQNVDTGQSVAFHELLSPLAELRRQQSLSLAPLLDLVDARENEFLDTSDAATQQAAHALALFIAPDPDLPVAMLGYEQLLQIEAAEDCRLAVEQIRASGRAVRSVQSRLLVSLTEIYLAELQRREYTAPRLSEVMPHPSRALRLFWKRLWMKGSV